MEVQRLGVDTAPSEHAQSVEKARSSKAWCRKRIFFIRLRGLNINGRKRYEHNRVNAKLFMRPFKKTENGGFRNALVWTGPGCNFMTPQW